MAPQSRDGRRGAGPEVHRVTSAQESLSEEQRRRTRRYLISMSIRTVCFIAAIVALSSMAPRTTTRVGLHPKRLATSLALRS